MKNLFTLLGLMVFCVAAAVAQTSGGPDTYGYTWRDSNDPNGPTFNWINIQDIGVQVTGLTDDNATAPIPMGMDFHYYWYDVSDIVIGSNGWLSFNNVSNIAHCFPTIPTAGGSGDNYLAPFMTDLIMNAAGTNAEVYYWFDSSNDQFVVSYLNVPWWQLASPGYAGANNFQVILSGQDSTITFQYQNMDQGLLADNAGCNSDLIIGMENITGNIGLGLSQFTEVVPSDNYAIKFYPPAVALISIPDIMAVWNQNAANKGVFIQSGVDYNLSSYVKNVGNANVSTNINVATNIQNLNSVSVYTSSDDIAGLTAGQGTAVTYQSPVNLAVGQYSCNVLVTNSSDINPGNNTRVTEVNAVDVAQNDVLFSYATQNFPDGNVGWDGGGGMGVYMEPPVYPAELNSVDVFVAAGINGPSPFTIQILAADGVGGLPGTVLQSVGVDSASYTPDAWVNVPLTSAQNITSGGVYIGFIHGANGVFLGTETAGPISRQSFEYVGGSWATYRENTNVDLLINGHFHFSPTVGVSENEEELLIVYPNPGNGLFRISGNLESNSQIRVFNAVGELVASSFSNSGAGMTIDLRSQPAGVYFLQVSNEMINITQKLIVE